MPPISFVGASTATQTPIGNGPVVATTPSLVKRGDLLLFVIAQNDNTNTVPAPPAGWTLFASQGDTNGRVLIHWRIVTDDEAPSHALQLANGTLRCAAVLLAYRAAADRAVVLSGGGNVTATTQFTCPSLNVVQHSELYLGVCQCTTAAVAITSPGGTTQRHSANGTGTDNSILVFDTLPEAIGASGTKTATTAAAQSGIAMAFLVRAQPAVAAPELVPDIPGAIGFVEIGV